MLAAALCSIGPSSASGAIININPIKDNTLYEFVPGDGNRSNALGDHFFAGVTAEAELRRGVLAFDIAGSIPAGSTITSVSLSMNMSRTISDTRTVELHVLLADWGEGTSNANDNEGQGAPATRNDATWRHRFYSTIFWSTLGGDFSAVASASQAVGDIGEYAWTSAQMVADVQSWLDNPATNFGWLVLGDESAVPTSKRFDTRESTSPPVLTIEYTEHGGIPCGDLVSFQARCQSNGGSAHRLQAKLTLTDTSHSGEQVTITVDGRPFTVIINGNQAQLSLNNPPLGQHTIVLTDPAGCFPPRRPSCN